MSGVERSEGKVVGEVNGARVCGALPPIVRTLALTISVTAAIGVGRVACSNLCLKSPVLLGDVIVRRARVEQTDQFGGTKSR